MNVTNNDFQVISDALEILKDFEGVLSPRRREILENAEGIMEKLNKKKEKDNARIAQYIAEKRKTNKNYAR